MAQKNYYLNNLSAAHKFHSEVTKDTTRTITPAALTALALGGQRHPAGAQAKLRLGSADSILGPHLPGGSLQQSPASGGSLLPASRTTFQLPSGCLRQMVIYRPVVVTGFPFASLL